MPFPTNGARQPNQSPSFPGNGIPFAGQGQSLSAPLIAPANPQNSMNGYTPYAPVTSAPPGKAKSGPNVLLFILLGILVLLLIGGGLTGWLYIKNRNQNSLPAVPTFVIKTPTTKPLFQDTFTSNTNGWDLSSTPGKFVVNLAHGALTLEDDDNKLLWEILPGKNFADFRLEVDATLTKGDAGNGYGVYIRSASTANSEIGTYYRFELYGDGSFALFKGTLDASGNTVNTQVGSYTIDSAILKAGQRNHITVIAKGSSMTFMVNDVTVTSYTDASYRGGLVALFVSNLPNLPRCCPGQLLKPGCLPCVVAARNLCRQRFQ